MLKGSYRNYHYDSVERDIKDRIGEITTEYTLQQIEAIDSGYASDSVEFMSIRQGMSQKIIGLYQEQLNFIAQTNEDLTKDLESARGKRASDEEIQKLQDNLNRSKSNQDKAGGELKIAKRKPRDSNKKQTTTPRCLG
ncbi:hypothetical protein SAMN05428961_11363 [Paenibacillus sp. OK060]|uniref:hypothetical protein n=1 Tax=Paenibacillus sp. OK060 TaxID=1881034 RepID=UPI00087FB65D|nr:hypothetical protein [Paenibacillus sp. OK060]SDM31076.1 hypothetical protein SAMN05428961_11363 [Paenibacillus sp. OK060]